MFIVSRSKQINQSKTRTGSLLLQYTYNMQSLARPPTLPKEYFLICMWNTDDARAERIYWGVGRGNRNLARSHKRLKRTCRKSRWMINTLMNADRTKPKQATIIGCSLLSSAPLIEDPGGAEISSNFLSLLIKALSWHASWIIGHYFVFVAVAKSERLVLRRKWVLQCVLMREREANCQRTSACVFH